MRISLIVALVLVSLPMEVRSIATGARPTRLVFEGTVLSIAPAPEFVSGDTAVYRLARYRVSHVCAGRYTLPEIVVDHLVLSGRELHDTKPGDEVCVSVTKRKNIGLRYNAEGIRATNDVVKVFYVGGEVQKAQAKTPCSCVHAQTAIVRSWYGESRLTGLSIASFADSMIR